MQMQIDKGKQIQYKRLCLCLCFTLKQTVCCMSKTSSFTVWWPPVAVGRKWKISLQNKRLLFTDFHGFFFQFATDFRENQNPALVYR